MKTILAETGRFLRQHWIHLLLAAPGAIFMTVLHETAHALAAVIQGGKITEFVCKPSMEEWGHVSYCFAAGSSCNQALISLAPYLMWMALCLLAGTFSLRRRAWSSAASSSIFVWLFIAPVGDIANAVIPYVLWNDTNDFHQAFGDISAGFTLAAAAAAMIIIIYGYGINKRLYRRQALSIPAYLLLVSVAFIAIVAVTA